MNYIFSKVFLKSIQYFKWYIYCILKKNTVKHVFMDLEQIMIQVRFNQYK